MPELLEKKAGIISCSGEELAEGTVTRLAALKVLHETRRGDTVTLCLPLFLAGGEGERTFAKFYPTITVDGCDLRCAARATERYSAKPAASLVITDLAVERGITGIAGCRRLNEAGQQAVEVTAEVLAGLVDQVLGRKGATAVSVDAGARPAPTCSCGSGVPVSWLDVGGASVEVLALPTLMDQLHQAGRPADQATAMDLLARVKVYNEVPAGADAAWIVALQAAYADHCRQKEGGR